jgi:hypothetical protein
MLAEEVQQDIRSDVVRQIADHKQLLLKMAQRSQIDGQNILFEYLDILLVGKTPSQILSQFAVEFYGDQPLGCLSKQFRDGRFARADLDDGLIGEVSESFHDADSRIVVGEKVLS